MNWSAWVCVFSIALAVRATISIHGHSGQGKPPMFGDFEAQRHWKEITIALPLGDWYRNTSTNDLMYWGLDYPPLSAYHSYAMGKIAQVVVPNSVALHTSRGAEDWQTKAFMRLSSLLSDACVFFPAVYVYVSHANPTARTPTSAASIYDFLSVFAMMLNPSLMLIDHGHFQYNNVSIGLSILAMTAILKDKDILGSILFCAALNYKQMSLYLAPAFFFFLLRKCFASSPAHTSTYTHPLVSVFRLGVCVCGSFAILWVPFCMFKSDDETCVTSMLAVLKRIFPFNRGLFEDKVSNLWYTLSVLYDLRQAFTHSQLAIMSLVLTLALLSPMALCLCLSGLPRTNARTHTNKVFFTLVIINSALAFFLASFQVHEKSLLLALVPAGLLIGEDLFVGAYIQILGCFTMYPLIIKDELGLAYAACVCVYICVLTLLHTNTPEQKHPEFSRPFRTWIMIFIGLAYTGMCILHGLWLFVPPPARYPHLYPALFSMYGALNLTCLYLYCVCWLWNLGIHESKPKKD